MSRMLKRFDRMTQCRNLIVFEENVATWLTKNCSNVTPSMFNLKMEKEMIDMTACLTENYGKINL
jgi:hypothetical protein